MNKIAKAALSYLHNMVHRPRPQRILPEPDAAYGKPAPMTGLWGGMTDEQKKFVRSYRGPQNVGHANQV